MRLSLGGMRRLWLSDVRCRRLSFRVHACEWCLILFFFFQAEDGIRDLTVTGVQTCALPISPPTRGSAPPPGRRVAPRLGRWRARGGLRPRSPTPPALRAASACPCYRWESWPDRKSVV